MFCLKRTQFVAEMRKHGFDSDDFATINPAGRRGGLMDAKSLRVNLMAAVAVLFGAALPKGNPGCGSDSFRSLRRDNLLYPAI
jgi:hypothetical protein